MAAAVKLSASESLYLNSSWLKLSILKRRLCALTFLHGDDELISTRIFTKVLQEAVRILLRSKTFCHHDLCRIVPGAVKAWLSF